MNPRAKSRTRSFRNFTACGRSTVVGYGIFSVSSMKSCTKRESGAIRHAEIERKSHVLVPNAECGAMQAIADRPPRRLDRGESADGDVVSVRIPERELLGFSARVYLRFFVEPGDENAGPLQRFIEIIDTKKQQ
jgi:hypothetical protein